MLTVTETETATIAPIGQVGEPSDASPVREIFRKACTCGTRRFGRMGRFTGTGGW